ncbi:phage tail protein [Neisseria dumasiana]|uniref:Phage tail protein n=1 Tax=Neisseria dumasiana TaxID=1931275 RepID=A0A1X3DKZ0_9NEIS|nr:phage tail protein [Neisseria dumasiana]OSI25062.1 phage tail protein [Neisseria dumasiana]
MSTEYVGSVTLYLGAQEIEITKIDVKDNTGKKPVKTMNRTRRTKGFTRGVGQYDITFTAVVPTDGKPVDWANIDDAKISLVPDVEGARPTSYLGFCVTEAGDSYTVDNELVVDVSGFAVRKVLE